VASSSAWASSGCSATVVGVGSGLLSSIDICELSAPATCCVGGGTTSPVVGGWLLLLSAPARTMSLVSSSPWFTGSEEGISCENTNSTVRTDYSLESTRLHHWWYPPPGWLSQ
jgi:hypothetical protein